MDRHFAEAPSSANLPVLPASVDVWYRNFHGREPQHRPHHQGLRRLPAYLQQLEMESNGKRRPDGEPVPSRPARIWGEPGTNGQHA